MPSTQHWEHLEGIVKHRLRISQHDAREAQGNRQPALLMRMFAQGGQHAPAEHVQAVGANTKGTVVDTITNMQGAIAIVSVANVNNTQQRS